MRFLHLTFLYCIVNLSSGDPALESPTKILQSITANPITTNDVVPAATNIILQSKDGGQTWDDISYSLPDNEPPKGFFAGASDIYLRGKNGMYHSKSNLKTPVWEKETTLDPGCSSIAFNRSGIMAYNYEGQIFQNIPSTRSWLPIYTDFKKQSLRTIFETLDGTVFLGSDNGLYKSNDKGRNWKQVLNEGWVMELVESKGVLIGTGQKGILRSTDNGEHWEWVINEGGVGIDIECIDGGFAAISCNATTISRKTSVSFDKGKTWKAIDEGFQNSLVTSSIKQMGQYLIFSHPDGIFRSFDMGKTWNIVHSGADNKVFEIYASGNILYAVAKDPGC